MTDAIRVALRAEIRSIIREELARLATPEEYLSIRGAADLAGVVPATVRRWVREGKLARHGAGRHLRVRRAELEEFLRRGGRGEENQSPEDLADRLYG